MHKYLYKVVFPNSIPAALVGAVMIFGSIWIGAWLFTLAPHEAWYKFPAAFTLVMMFIVGVTVFDIGMVGWVSDAPEDDPEEAEGTEAAEESSHADAD